MQLNTTSKNLYFLVYSIFLAITIGCQRDVDSSGFGGTNTNPIDQVKVIAGIRGVVIDENNQPVANAAVSSGTSSTITDKYGIFHFKNISLSKENGFVNVVKPGYFTGSRSFVTTAGRIHNVRIKLIPKINSGTFNAATGGSVTLANGAKITLPASAITDASGNAYSGTVNIAMTWIDPTANNLPEIIPGDLRGLTTTNEERGLETFGMIGVEMTGPGNAALKIATGKKAELSFPLPASLSGSAPSTIDLWHFDETTGRWKQEGTATKTGNTYVAQVSHFSFWNCDAPFPLINLCMTLVHASNAQPLSNVQVRIKRTNGSYGSGWTDSVGNLCGKVPKNEALILQVMDQCNTVAYSQNIGPFSTDTNLGTIQVNFPAANTLTITGTVTNCAGSNVTNGVAIIYTPGSYSYVTPLTGGNFSLTIPRCSAGTINFTVVGVDQVAMQQSFPTPGSGTTGTVSMGTIQACGTSTLQFVEYIIDGTIYSFTSPPDQMICFDSTGFPAPLTRKTSISAFRGSAGTVGASGALTFSNNGVAGTLPLTSGRFQWAVGLESFQFVNPNPVVNITVFGPTGGGFIEGNYNELMNFAGTPRNVICTFRVRRN